ncbi:MAG: hypothetical protein HN909_02695 [Phycisphaerales bacterium]|jgi:hypothetical protein|nr:hypothetical protein [Phycisphaerales bacterium]MBT7170660.1 hypothetical protein [Phycisphaerales bacterium]
MSYLQQNETGRLDISHHARGEDLTEICSELNRRRTIYFTEPEPVPTPSGPISSDPPNDLRDDIETLLAPRQAYGQQRWVWPLAGADENKPLVVHSTSNPDETGLLQQIGSTGYDWKRAPAEGDWIDAEDMNELRLALEHLYRVRHIAGVSNFATLSDASPDLCFSGMIVYNNSVDGERRALGYFILRYGQDPKGITPGVTILPNSILEIFAYNSCVVDVYHIPSEVPYDGTYPTWNNLDASTSWTGGLGTGATLLGQVTCASMQLTPLSNAALISALQRVADDGEQFNLLFVPSGTHSSKVSLNLQLTVYYELTDIIEAPAE